MNTKILATIVASGLAMLTSGCASLRGSGLALWPANWGNEEGYIWCNARYLDLWAYPDIGTVNPERDVRLRLAERGYPYAVAAALTLQKPGKSEDKHFAVPTFLMRDARMDEDDSSSGFQAATYLLHQPGSPGGSDEVVVAFRGSDSWRDYWKHNLTVFRTPAQYKPARAYVRRVAARYPDRRLVVTGFSLGGGLAVHVTRDNETSRFVKEAWAFNPSPRTGHAASDDSRVFMAAVKGEILSVARRGGLGAPKEQYSNEFGLVRSSSVYGHSRWVLTRQMLSYADLVAYDQAGRPADFVSPPLEILAASNEPSGCKGKRRADLVQRGRLPQLSQRAK